MQTLRRVLFVSQRQAEGMRVPKDAALVSITDPSRPPASLASGWHAVLRLSFDDIDPVTFPGRDAHLTALSPSQVAEIAAFSAQHARCCKRIVVHCRHGISRSAAVAKVIAQAAGIGFPAAYDEYNRHGHRMLNDAVRRAFDGA